MKISWNHLQSFFADKLDRALVLERLTMAGLEVEDDSPVAPEFSGIVVGEVVECIKHPDADKLSLCKVNVAETEPLQIICGASNVAVGVKVPCAKVGAVLPGDFKITERKMRGIVSYGMLCSGTEIGYPSDVDGLLLLDGNAPVGLDIREYLDLNDSIVEFKITPNRGDCLSYRGLAREVAALTAVALKPQVNIENKLNSLSSTLKLEVQASNECPHYVGLAIHAVNNQLSSPDWLIRVLERSGIRPISPLVDVANYVMLLFGQPLHTFDLNKVSSGVTVRMAQVGEELKLIDGSTAKLQENTLLIVDNLNNKPVAIAGVMGSLDSGVSVATTELLLESAFFTPDTIQGKAKLYGVSSDAAFRFERGVDPEIQHDAINLAAQLIIDICGGRVGEYIHFDKETTLRASHKISLSFLEIERLVGQAIPHNVITKILSDLGCIVSVDGNLLEVIAPSYRFDLQIKQDIIEEIIRVYGYDRIDAQMPVLAHALESLDTKLNKNVKLKQVLSGYGFNEIISYAFIEEKYAKLFSDGNEVVRLQNPIAGLNVMRSNLLAGLVKSLQYNVNRGQESIRLFELARVFHGETVEAQPLHLAGLMYGKYSSLNWSLTPREIDFYDLSQVLQEILSSYGTVELEAESNASYMHPGRSAAVLLNGNKVGVICQLHPSLSNELGLDILPYVFEVDIGVLEEASDISLQNISKFQKISRDLAFVLDKSVEVGAILQRIAQLKLSELIDFNVFDIFSGGSLGANEKSVAVNFVFQSDKTLSDEDVNPALELVKNLVVNEFNGNLR
ncbi:MAG: phenylalanine--tRNA ligase subunit beta [Neisseriaceae bacterium]|nr:MAG: phenylalanine--tRNA ligase subunit beta [Neisseriaceae bacterium]